MKSVKGGYMTCPIFLREKQWCLFYPFLSHGTHAWKWSITCTTGESRSRTFLPVPVFLWAPCLEIGQQRPYLPSQQICSVGTMPILSCKKGQSYAKWNFPEAIDTLCYLGGNVCIRIWLWSNLYPAQTPTVPVMNKRCSSVPYCKSFKVFLCVLEENTEGWRRQRQLLSRDIPWRGQNFLLGGSHLTLLCTALYSNLYAVNIIKLNYLLSVIIFKLQSLPSKVM